jgi:hypothetical protein
MTTITRAENMPPEDALDPLQSLLRSVEPVAVILDFVGVNLDDYDRLIRAMHLASGGSALPGCLFHWARSTPDGLRICEIWRNRALFEFFEREELLPAYRRLRFPEPELDFYPVHNYLTSADLVD